MTKETYLRFLRAYLTNRLPAEEVEDIMAYYTEYFADAGEGHEAEVMAELGSPEQLAHQILGERHVEVLVPDQDHESNYGPGSYVQTEYAPSGKTGIPRWAYILILVLAAIFVGPPLVGLVFGLGLAGLVCVIVGIGVAIGAMGTTLSLPGILYQSGGGLLAAAAGLVLFLGAVLLVKITIKLLRWFRENRVEGGTGYEEMG